jgi:hypothetical protein
MLRTSDEVLRDSQRRYGHWALNGIFIDARGFHFFTVLLGSFLPDVYAGQFHWVVLPFISGDGSIFVEEGFGDQRKDLTRVFREFEKARRDPPCLSAGSVILPVIVR